MSAASGAPPGAGPGAGSASAPVAINARAAPRAEIGGVERVARELAARLPRLQPGRYRVVRPPAALAHRAGHAWEQLALPLAARGAELVYSPANLAPLAAGARNVVAIHDVAALRHPEWYGRAYAAWQRRLLPALARRARMLVADSAFGRAELVEALGADPARVAVVPLGVDERFSPRADPEPARARYDLERPYALTVATRIARKNLSALDRAATLLAREGIDLVAAGSGRAYMHTGAGAPAGLRTLGYVDDELLPGLYAGATAFALPSLYEGFGLPCLEAMACGTPVVASDRGALPETCGGAALLVDPEDPDALAEALLDAARDAGLRERLTEAGLARARELTWDRTARETDALISGLLD